MTGGAGFVCRHLAESLTTEGHEVAVIARGQDQRDTAGSQKVTGGRG
jgi:nucleoside-diphosphate-sugar epimerase